MAEPALASAPQPCYHCGEPIPSGADFAVEISGQARLMCCPGCRAVATLIAANGLEQFYEQRTAYSEKPVEADVVLNLAKLKTHTQMMLTLGVKNLFGCIVGLKKPECVGSRHSNT